jgi:4-amino-4-deoxy-L-arabinose transferase-like glycosyltransferase
MSAAATRPRPTLSRRSQLDAPRQAYRLALVLPLLLAAAVMVLYFQAQPRWLADPDAQDYAQLGRQLAAGRGPVTSFLPWNGVAYLAERGQAVQDTSSWPNITRFPLTPVLMALSFGVFGASDEAVHLPAALAFVGTAGCAALLAARVYGAWAGFVAGLTVACLPLLVNYSLTGLTEPLLGMLLLGMVACVVGEAGPRRLLLGGGLLGLMTLNRYDSALLGGVVIWLWLLPRPDRWQATARFLLPAALLVLPWAAYLTVVAGAPLFNLQPASIAAQASGRAGGLGWYLPEYVTPAEVWTGDPSRAGRLALEELVGTPNHLRKLLGWPWLVVGGTACVLALAWSVLAGRRARGVGVGGGLDAAPAGWLTDRSRLAILLVAAVLVRALLASLLGLNLQRHFVPLVPLLLVVVAGEADWLVRSVLGWSGERLAAARMLLMPSRLALAGLLVVPGLLTVAPFLVPPREPHSPPTRPGEVEARPENLTRLAEIVHPGSIVASNVAWSVALHADRPAVPLPPSVDDTARLESRFGISLEAIYVAGQVSVADAPRGWRTWEERRRNGTPPSGYVLAASFENGGRLFIKAR